MPTTVKAGTKCNFESIAMPTKNNKKRVFCRTKMNKHKREEKRDKKKEHSPYIPIFLGIGFAVVCFVLFIGIEVESATDYYVSLSGNDANDGLTLDTAWRTITYAATQAQAGDTVYIKGGDYGHEHVVVANSGTEANPIVFEGYDGIPVIDGQDLTGTGILVDSKEYIEIKNIKVTQYTDGVYLKYSNHITLDGIIGFNLGGAGSWVGNGIFLLFSDYCNLQNCSVTDAWMDLICIVYSNYNHIENCTVYSRGTEPSARATDYYIFIGWGHDNIIRNCLAHNMHGGIDVHRGHGIVIKDNPGQAGVTPHSYNNKIIDCECYACQECFVVAHGAHDNEFINCTADRADLTVTNWHNGLVVRDGAYYNTFKNCRAVDFRWGIYLGDTIESPGEQIQHDNTFLNCIISDSSYGIHLYDAENNKFKNCTITRAGTLFQFKNEKGNSLTNCIITDIASWASGSGNPTITYSDFWNNGFSIPSGTGNMEEDPLFADPANDDFHLKSQYGRWNGSQWVYDIETSPCIDAGDPFDDYSNEPLPNYERINMGAYGNTVEASKSPLTGTISGTAGLFKKLKSLCKKYAR